MTGNSQHTRERPYWLLSVIAPVVAVLATVPIAEMGTNDDFSYTFIARRLAETGHLHYDGWNTTMVGVSAYWAAFLIRLFGFSFTLVRLSTLPFAAGCGALLYWLGRFARLNRSLALFGSLTVTISPLYIPLAASFMTDVPGLFWWLLSICAALASSREERLGRASMLLALGAVAGVVGGSVRQVVWIAPMVALPLAAWRHRSNRRFIVVAAALWCAAGVASFICLHWFNQQPYVQLQEFSVTAADIFSRDTLGSVVRLLYAAVLFLLPVLAFFVSGIRFRKSFAFAAAMMTAILATFIVMYPGRTMTGNIVTSAGIMSSGTDVLGGKPVLLTAPIVFGIRAAMWLAGTAALGSYRPFSASRDDGVVRIGEPRRAFFLMYSAASAVYLAAVLYRSLDTNIMFDRYLLEILPLLVIALLAAWQDWFGSRIPAAGWAVLAIFALYGVAVTHDAFAGDRARVRAAGTLIAAGIPRTEITAGFEYDGWTEIEHNGYINSDDIVHPAGAYKPQDDRRYPLSPEYWFWSSTPSIEPAYFITYEPVQGLSDSQFQPVVFKAWLPPFQREARILIQRSWP